MRIIAGDVGGTKTLVQYLDADGSVRKPLIEHRFESTRYPTFERLLTEFAALGVTRVDSACFAVAGPVVRDTAEITNVGWKIDALELRSRFDIPTVILVNDFYAAAVGVPLLAEADLVPLNRGTRDRTAPMAILGAGTGLGEAAVLPDADRWRVVPSEGGHADFAPHGAEQMDLYRALEGKYGHVSNERVLSGQGLADIYQFLCSRNQGIPSSAMEPTAEVESLPARISARAREGDALARHAFELFVDAYGAEAGNMALRLLASGGVFLAGGVAAKNIEHFVDGRFMQAFADKGRFSRILWQIPVDLIANETVGLIGAVEMAWRGRA
jgi:glucokinase